MKFSYNWLKTLARITTPPQELADILNVRSFEVETVEKVGADFALDAKIPANRISDAAHHMGFAREIAAVLGTKTIIPSVRLKKTAQKKTRPAVRISIASSTLCPRYTAQIIEIDAIKSSPAWMQERLITCGMRPIDAVVDITNYVMLETGQPLHAFDLDKIHGRTMTIRESKEKERFTTLDGTEHILPQSAIVIEDARGLTDLAGIMGGVDSAVSPATKRILLQAAAFDPVRIYKATRALNFSSAAAKIYSSGTDPAETKPGLMRAIALLEDILNARRIGSIIDLYPKKAPQYRLRFRPESASRIIGEPLAPAFYVKTFTRLGFKVSKAGKDLSVMIPSIRRDIRSEEDLIEEAARMFGYDRIPAKVPELPITPSPVNEIYAWEERVRDALVGSGFSESILYEFTSDRELEQFRIEIQKAPRLENPMSPETKYLVPRLLIKYVSSAAENLRHEEAIYTFGIGKSFQKTGEGVIHEQKDLVLSFARTGTSGEDEFYELKGILERLLESLGIDDAWYDDVQELGIRDQESGIFHPYRFAEIKVGDERIGMIGEIHPAIIERLRARARITTAEIDMQKLAALAHAESEFRPIDKYPAIIRDIAVVVPENVRTDDVLNVIENTGGALLADTDLFDYFRDDALGESQQKSLAFHLVFQSPERTLTDAEIDTVIKKIIAALESKEWEVKK